MPLAVTAANEPIFNAFNSKNKINALLYKYNYTAHPVGYAVAMKSLTQLLRIEKKGGGIEQKRGKWLLRTIKRKAKPLAETRI